MLTRPVDRIKESRDIDETEILKNLTLSGKDTRTFYSQHWTQVNEKDTEYPHHKPYLFSDQVAVLTKKVSIFCRCTDLQAQGMVSGEARVSLLQVLH